MSIIVVYFNFSCNRLKKKHSFLHFYLYHYLECKNLIHTHICEQRKKLCNTSEQFTAHCRKTCGACGARHCESKLSDVKKKKKSF